MADDTTTAPAPIDAEALQRAIAALQPPTQPPVLTEGGPATHGVAGFLSDVGTALSGGQTGLLGLSPDEQATAGRHALLRFGIDMLAASGKSYAPKDFGSVLAAGLGGAQQAQQESENRAYVGRGASQQLAQQAFQNRIAAIKEAIPLLQLDYQQKLLAAQRASALAATGGGKGTSIADAAADPVTALPREQALDALAQRESGWKNVPNAEGGDASGFWQIRDATWRDGAKLAGVDVSKYPRAIDAPKDVQRQVAGAIYDRDGAKPWAASAPGRGVAARTGGTDVAGPGAGGGTTAAPTAPALPLPPEPPADGIPVPGGSGMRVYPDGKIGTPGQEGRPPATQIATAAPAATTTAPATTAPAVTAPAVTAPTPPPVTPTTIPDTFTEFKKQHPEELTPSDEERATWSTSPDPAQLKNVQQQRQDAQDRIRAARAAIPTSTDPSKQTAEIDAAKKDLDIAITAENTMREDARKTGMERRASWYKDREAQLATSYNAAVTARDTRQTNRDAVGNEINKDTAKDALTTFNNSRGVVTQLHGFQAISDAIDQPGWMQTTKFPWSDHTVAEQLQQMGVLGDSEKGKLAAAQLLKGGMINLVKTLRAGMPMGSLSDRDLTFIERMGPTEWMDRDTRTAATRYLLQAYQAQKDYSQTVLRELSKPGGNYSTALDAAEKQAGPIVPTVTDPELGAHWNDQTGNWPARRLEWARANKAPVGTLIHLPDGSVHVITRKPVEQP